MPLLCVSSVSVVPVLMRTVVLRSMNISLGSLMSLDVAVEDAWRADVLPILLGTFDGPSKGSSHPVSLLRSLCGALVL